MYVHVHVHDTCTILKIMETSPLKARLYISPDVTIYSVHVIIL